MIIPDEIIKFLLKDRQLQYEKTSPNGDWFPTALWWAFRVYRTPR